MTGKTFDLRAGERRCILWIFSSSIPGTVRFAAKTQDGDAVSGSVELARRRWLDWHRTHHPLYPHNVFDKGFSDTDYRIYVTPDQDCRVTFQTRHLRAEAYFVALAVLLGLGLAAGLGASMLGTI